jgi:HAD superfamily hydrolase (TIGR01450 family)
MNLNLILDIDGTIIENSKPINNSIAFMENLQRDSVDFLLATNSVRSHKNQVERLGNLGFNVSLSSFYTPVDAINVHLDLNKINRAFTIGSRDEIEQIHCEYSESAPQLIILLDFTKEDISHSVIQKIIDLSLRGVPVITATASTSYPSKGKTIIDTGAYAKLIESITGTPVSVFGKPSTSFFTNALKCFKSPGETWIVGDDIETDIAGGLDAGLNTALVKTGKYKPGCENITKPHLVINDFDEFYSRLL